MVSSVDLDADALLVSAQGHLLVRLSDEPRAWPIILLYQDAEGLLRRYAPPGICDHDHGPPRFAQHVVSAAPPLSGGLTACYCKEGR